MGLNKNSKNDLEGFKAYILIERNFSEHTAKAYCADVLDFLLWLDELSCEDVTFSKIREYLQIGYAYDTEQIIFRHHQPESQEYKHDSADTEIHEIFHDDIAGIFCPCKACFDHGETALHEEYKSCTNQKPYTDGKGIGFFDSLFDSRINHNGIHKFSPFFFLFLFSHGERCSNSTLHSQHFTLNIKLQRESRHKTDKASI